jgi:Ankyrin repeats (3 copies)
MKKIKSQTRDSSTGIAVFLTLFCIFWDGIVFGLMLKQSHIPFWFKSIFVIAGVLITGLTMRLWWQRIVGGTVHLQLSQDPVPHGLAQTVRFDLSKDVHAQQWSVHASIAASQRNSSSFGTVWEQEFSAQHQGQRQVSCLITLPADHPSTQSSSSETNYQVKLTLKADSLSWTFQLQTRPARSNESLGNVMTSAQLGTKVRSYSPEEIVKMRKRWTGFAGVFALAVIALQMWSFLGELVPWSPFSKAKASVLPDVYSTQVTSQPFELLVTNFLISDWALRGRLRGIAQVQAGELIVKITEAQIRPMGTCNDNRTCDVKSIRLLLSETNEQSFSTRAESNELIVNAKLAEISAWRLPAGLQGSELRMRLPAAVDAKTMRLKLEIRSQSNSTVYPQNGPYLNLHRALAQASGKQDPCENLSHSRADMAAAGCTKELESTLANQKQPNTFKAMADNVWQKMQGVAVRFGLATASAPKLNSLDDLLIESLKNENAHLVAMLLRLGASANAEDRDHKGRSALGYATSANNIEAMQLLLAAGANPNLRLTNEKKQIVTPLTQALRSDPSQAVELLLQKGATMALDDPQGWTAMHIAAYESAHQSITVMAKMGGDVNEKTSAYRQQTAFHTALQFANVQTIQTMLSLGADLAITDNQNQNACGWANFFKRSDDIKSLVCFAAPITTPPSIIAK